MAQFQRLFAARCRLLRGLNRAGLCFYGCRRCYAYERRGNEAEDDHPSSSTREHYPQRILSFGMIIALLYCQGNIMQNLTTPASFPFIEAFLQALHSLPWATAYTSVLLVLLVFANVSVLTATSRATYAFARDNALPFSSWIGHLHEGTKLPLWALLFSVVVTMLLGLIVSIARVS